MPDTTHVLLWSGGFDSTAILLDMVANPDKFQSVRLVSATVNSANLEEDKLAREKILKILDIEHNGRFLVYNNDLDGLHIDGAGQSFVWAFLAAGCARKFGDEVELCFGYIRGDDLWHYKHEFETAVRAMIDLKRSPDPGPKVNFYYPYEWATKKEIVCRYLNYPEVFSAISWGGDTATCKLKEKEELQFLFDQLRVVKNAYVADEVLKKEEPDTNNGDGI